MIQNLSSRLQTLFVLMGLVILFGIASPHFLTTDNLLNVMQQSAINAILGIGLTFVIISGGIDLSVGSILALCGLVVADLLVAGHSILTAVTVGLLVGLGCGLLNGLITTLGRIPPFITTLGMMLMARSAAKICSGSKPISGLPDSFRALSGDIAGVPVMVLIVAVLYIAAHLVLTRSKLGRYTYAIGGNEQAAWLSGVPVGLYKVAIYSLSGLMAGVATAYEIPDGGRDEELQADYLRDIMTIAFSHPGVEAIVMWGFQERCHWRPAAALWRKDWSIKPAGEAWVDLVRGKWWTDETLTTDGKGIARARCFLGTHTIQVGNHRETTVISAAQQPVTIRIAKSQKIVQTGLAGIPPTMFDWLDAVAAAKITTDPWCDDPWGTRLLADPQSLLPK